MTKNRVDSPILEEGYAQRAYMGIRQMLFHNELVPGQKIAYRELADRFGMSVTPVIHALKWLELLGLVHREPNKGYYAEPISLKQVEEIYDLREVVELSLLPKAIKNTDKKTVKQFKASLNASVAALRGESLTERLIKDMEFHLALASLSGCDTQQRVLRQLYDLLYLKYRSSMSFGISMRAVAETDHQDIYKSVVSGDLEKAKKALSQHILNAKKHVIAGLSRMMREKEESTF